MKNTITTKQAAASFGETRKSSEHPAFEEKKHDLSVLGPPLPPRILRKIVDPKDRIKVEKEFRAEVKFGVEYEAAKVVARWSFGVQSEVSFEREFDSSAGVMYSHFSREFLRFRPELVSALWSNQEILPDGRDPVARLSDRDAAVVELTPVVYLIQDDRAGSPYDANELARVVYNECYDYRESDVPPFLKRVGVTGRSNAIFKGLVKDAAQIAAKHGTLIMGFRDVFLNDVFVNGNSGYSGAESWNILERISGLVETWDTGQNNSIRG